MKPLVAAAWIGASCVGLVGCGWLFEPKPDVDAPQTFQLDGLSLSYPGNWKASSESEEVEGITVTTATFESSGNAMVMLQQFTPAVPLNLLDLADEYATSIQQSASSELGGIAKVDVGASTEVRREVLGASREGTQTKLSISVLGEAVPHTLDIVSAELDDRAGVFLFQVADEDRATSKPAVDLSLDSAQLDTDDAPSP